MIGNTQFQTDICELVVAGFYSLGVMTRAKLLPSKFLTNPALRGVPKRK